MIQKCLLLLLIISGITGNVIAQQPDYAVKLSHYIFESFMPGKVKEKSGVVTDQLLNYNILTKEMIYHDKGQFLAISNPKDVDTVYISNRRFIPVEEQFYEILTQTPVPLFLEVTCSVTQPGAPVGFGMTSTTTASNSLRALIQNGGAYGLKLPDEFVVKPRFNYLVLLNGKYEKANTVQQLVKLFPEKKKEIRAFFDQKGNSVNSSESQVALNHLVQQK